MEVSGSNVVCSLCFTEERHTGLEKWWTAEFPLTEMLVYHLHNESSLWLISLYLSLVSLTSFKTWRSAAVSVSSLDLVLSYWSDWTSASRLDCWDHREMCGSNRNQAPIDTNKHETFTALIFNKITTQHHSMFNSADRAFNNHNQLLHER